MLVAGGLLGQPSPAAAIPGAVLDQFSLPSARRQIVEGQASETEERIARLLIDQSEADLSEADLRGLRDLGGL